MEILKLGNPILRDKASSVEVFDENLKLDVEQMLSTLESAKGLGLAGPQVGIEKRLFVIIIDDERWVFINPEIIGRSDDKVRYEEGCLSIPGYYMDVFRPSKVKIQFQDISGKMQILDASGLLARVIQHEYDHLDGKLFVDRLDEKTQEAFFKSWERSIKHPRRRP